MCVLGMAEEFRGEVAVNALWPQTGLYIFKKYIMFLMGSLSLTLVPMCSENMMSCICLKCIYSFPSIFETSEAYVLLLLLLLSFTLFLTVFLKQ